MLDVNRLTTGGTGTVTARGRLRPVASKAALCLVYVVFVYAHVVALQRDGFRLSLALLAGFETAMLVLIFVRRDSTAVDRSALAVVAGLIGSFAALGFRPVPGQHDLLVAEVVQVIGVVLQLGASASLRRSFGLVPANRGIQTGGLYRVVRHPFYASYLVAQAGYLLNNPSARNLAIAALGVGCQVLRIRYEEALLAQDPGYRAYAAGVRWHLIPGVW